MTRQLYPLHEAEAPRQNQQRWVHHLCLLDVGGANAVMGVTPPRFEHTYPHVRIVLPTASRHHDPHQLGHFRCHLTDENSAPSLWSTNGCPNSLWQPLAQLSGNSGRGHRLICPCTCHRRYGRAACSTDCGFAASLSPSTSTTCKKGRGENCESRSRH